MGLSDYRELLLHLIFGGANEKMLNTKATESTYIIL
jgi:hypothetical protein